MKIIELIGYTIVIGVLFLSLGCQPEPESSSAAKHTQTTRKEPVQKQMLKMASDPGVLNNDLQKQLETLGYMGGYETATQDSGVVTFDHEQTAPGLNLVVSGHGPEVRLMDSKGNTVHTWTCPRNTAFPDLQRTESDKKARSFRRAYVLPDGCLLGIYNGTGMVKLDPHSNILWTQSDMCHHDLCLSPDMKTIFTIVQQKRLFLPLNEASEVMDEWITEIDAETGKIVTRTSMLEAFHQSDYAPMLKRLPQTGDVLHGNTVAFVTGEQSRYRSIYHTGDILFSVRNMDTIGLLDLNAGKVRWALTGKWSVQHEPVILDNGNMLIFDNTGYRGHSRVVEIDPESQTIEWFYAGTEQQPLNSNTSGSCMRLTNGNTLITESNRGRALEVTPENKIVWEYLNPERWGPRKDLRATLFDVQRIPDSYFNEAFLSTL